MFPVPSPARSGPRRVAGHASQIRIAVPAVKDGGERVDVAGWVERRSGSEIRREMSLRRRRGQENGSSGREIREDLVPETQAMVENRAVLGGDAEVVSLGQFDHPVGGLGIVK